MRGDRLAFQVPLDVVGERSRRRIAALRFVRGRFQHDVVDVAAQLSPHALQRRRQYGRIGIRIDRRRRRARVAVLAAPARDELAEQYAERVDIRRGRDRTVHELLGRRIRRCHDRMLRARCLAFAVRIGIEQLGDAEIEQLHFAIARDQHVGWFQVAMHDQRAMRGLDRAADIDKQRKAPPKIETTAANERGDRFAVDEFQCDVRCTGIRYAAFDEPRDARMAKLREREAFAAEAALFVRRVKSAAQEFQRNRLAHAGLFAFGAKDDRRAAFAELVQQRERPYARSGRRQHALGFGGDDAAHQFVERMIEHARAAVLVGGEKPFDRGALPGIAAVRIEKLGALGRRHRERCFEKLAKRRCRIGHRGNLSCIISPVAQSPDARERVRQMLPEDSAAGTLFANETRSARGP